MISSQVIIACRGKRWFDLDAVRVPLADSPGNRYVRKVSEGDVDGRQHATTGIDRETNKITADYDPSVSGGAPPLDWHLDGHTASPPFEPREGTEMLRYIVGDTRDITATIPDDSVDLISTSPPFLALRSYLPADHADKHREIGSEANPAAFLDVLLELTAEWGRVLAPHGTLAVELGDTYSGSTADGGDNRGNDRYPAGRSKVVGQRPKAPGWPLAKSLALIPQLYAVALAYGINPLTGQPSPAGRWRVRNVIMWHRPNPPVGALGDKWRPASSAITVACRGPKRWFDLDAVRTESESAEHHARYPQADYALKYGAEDLGSMKGSLNPAGAPPLDWHTDGDLGVGHIILSTQPYAGSHYATFPMDLPRKIIDCMCPRQVCRVCGVARERVVNAHFISARDGTPVESPGLRDESDRFITGHRMVKGHDNGVSRKTETVGWTDCGHDNYRPGLCYDPFVGTGTTLAAAQDLGRDAIGADIDPRNAWLARERVGLFLDIEDHVPT